MKTVISFILVLVALVAFSQARFPSDKVIDTLINTYIASSKYSPQSDSTGIGDVAVNFARDQVGKCYS